MLGCIYQRHMLAFTGSITIEYMFVAFLTFNKHTSISLYLFGLFKLLLNSLPCQSKETSDLLLTIFKKAALSQLPLSLFLRSGLRLLPHLTLLYFLLSIHCHSRVIQESIIYIIASNGLRLFSCQLANYPAQATFS